jgi:hypothetical protein
MRDELLNETLFMSLDHARIAIAAWAEDYNRERPHSALGYETPAAFAAELYKQWPVPLRPSGSAPPTASHGAGGSFTLTIHTDHSVGANQCVYE